MEFLPDVSLNVSEEEIRKQVEKYRSNQLNFEQVVEKYMHGEIINQYQTLSLFQTLKQEYATY